MGDIVDFIVEFKRNDRFLIELPDMFELKYWCIQKTDKPKFTNGKWENIKIEFVDVISPSTSQGLFKIVDFIRKRKDDNKNLFDVKIKQLDQTGVPVEEWVISVEKILTINFGVVDYNNDDIQRPFLILKPLRCVLNNLT